MANLPETDNFDAGVYQLETTDPALGGANGVMNTPPKALTNRTRWLYNRVLALFGFNRGYAAATGTANAVAANYSPAVTALVDGTVFSFKVAAVNTGAATFTPCDGTISGTAAIAPLPIYGLDLQPLSGGELAGQCSLRYSAALNGGGGAYVLIENPGGIMRVLTAAANDSSNQAASTKFVHDRFQTLPAGLQPLGVRTGISGAATLTAAQAGVVELTTTGTTQYTTTLPTPVGLANTSVYYIIWNNTAVAQTIATPAASILASFAAGASIALPAQSICLLVSDAANWLCSMLRGDPAYAPAAGSPGQGFSVSSLTLNNIGSQAVIYTDSETGGLGPNDIVFRLGASGSYKYATLDASGNLLLPGYAVVANAAANNQAVNLGQANGLYASIAGNASQGFLVAAPSSGDNSARAPNTSWIWSNIQTLVAGCIAGVATATGFSGSFGTNGYIKLPGWLGGFITQWGAVTVSQQASTAFNFPVTFPNAVLGVTSTLRNGSLNMGAQFSSGADVISNSQFAVKYYSYSGGGTGNFFWLAWGN
ncbi:MAG: hypothetical protein PHU07_12315 [Acidocella sp.]|nr:hypothetical protein [Acidocella sp.]